MSRPDELCLNLLLFSVAGVHFGFDAEQVSEVNAYDGEESGDLFWFHQAMGFGHDPLVYQSPTVVTFRTAGEESYRLIIDGMEDIAGFCPDGLRPFPALLESLALQRGMWGILPRGGKMVLLVDILRLSRNDQEPIAANSMECEGDIS